MFGLMLLSTQAVADMPFPTVHEPSDESLKCIQPEDEMRRNHMNYIMHQRDITMHQGIRTETDSLAKCIDCHVEPNDNGKIAGIESKEHFCNACHQYTSVQIDCFQCHADRPQKYIDRGAHSGASLMNQLQQTLAANEKVSQ
jgi:hypothetical protein